MKATLRGVGAALAAVAAVGCGGLGGLNPMGGGGGGAGGYKPTECVNTQFAGNLADARKGRWVTYATEAGGQKTSQTVRIVGQDGDAWLVEQWMDLGSMAFGYLFKVGSDRKISKAWAAAKGDKSWAEIKVNEPPRSQPGDGPKPQIKESDEKREVKAGSFSCRRLDVTVNVQGKDYTSTSWFAKDVWRIYAGSEHGGLVATEASGSKTFLDGKGEDAAPTIELPSGK